MRNVSISPACVQTPSIVTNVEFAGYLKKDLSTAMGAIFVWIKDLKENMSAGLILGMKFAVSAGKTLFQAARFYPAHTRFIKIVCLHRLKMVDPRLVPLVHNCLTLVP